MKPLLALAIVFGLHAQDSKQMPCIDGTHECDSYDRHLIAIDYWHPPEEKPKHSHRKLYIMLGALAAGGAIAALEVKHSATPEPKATCGHFVCFGVGR